MFIKIDDSYEYEKPWRICRYENVICFGYPGHYSKKIVVYRCKTEKEAKEIKDKYFPDCFVEKYYIENFNSPLTKKACGILTDKINNLKYK